MDWRAEEAWTPGNEAIVPPLLTDSPVPVPTAWERADELLEGAPVEGWTP